MALSRPDTRIVLPLLVVLAVAAGGFAVWYGVFDSGTDETTVTVVDENGTTLAEVDVRVADSYRERYTGLSDTESLGTDEGMLFVHDASGRHAYVMRDMDFPLDIVFVAANGTITRIHHAPLPPEGTSESELKRYRGRGKYVLEVPYDYTTTHGIDEGDTVVVDGLDDA